MRPKTSYAEPFAWWGPVWTPPAPRRAVDLVREGTLDRKTAGLLAALLARRASVVVAAEPSGAGKTTLLTALLDFYPPDTRRLYLRGCYEPFAFLDDPALEPAASVLLVNEISAHLPAYLWGPAVRRTLEATRRGFALAATAHASDAIGFVRLLSGYPLRLPLDSVAAVDLVVLLDAWREGDLVRREVASVTALLPPVGAGGLTLAPLAVRPARGQPPAIDAAAAASFASRLAEPVDEASLRREIEERAVGIVGQTPSAAVAEPAPSDERWVPEPGIG